MEKSPFSSVKNERLYEKIVHQLLQLIEEGKLQPGDRLPAERKLAEILGCSRTSLREACRVLESEGVIISKPGGGRFIQRVDQKLTVKYQFNTVDMIEKTAIIYFLEAREALEPKIAELASKRATPENIAKLEKVMEKMEEKLKHPKDHVEADSSFHLALAEATQNFVFVSMMESNLNMIRQVRKQTLNNESRYLASLREHRAILDAIKRRDSQEAINACLVHLNHIRQHVLGESK
ncbi:FadR/GntR family transcriptional regulator [Halalkalibacter krulwichiae]|uniref:Putative L-lactate dehydrogenase operon regulatory protein n=1 Tax=Halalkalibacter krulwichiae TaxID=199441 RepID=A0A1X9MCP8_9BACI|nr:FadR/GntR family transcriptional regulator [Halalkalibacter krulwichiae]ARK31205.1 Putative L-lactate dehydrogenase operon regulatory protein [Halalkalibacter krulwichiae]